MMALPVMITTAPARATNGKIQVVTPNDTPFGDMPFRLPPKAVRKHRKQMKRSAPEFHKLQEDDMMRQVTNGAEAPARIKETASMKPTTNLARRGFALVMLCAMAALGLPAQTFATLFTFDGTNGSEPQAGLVQALNGDLYGMTAYGGKNDFGTVFRITTSGKLTSVHSFCSQPNCPGGFDQYGGLVQATNGYLYGVTDMGGAYGYGAVFKISPSGALTTLYSFCAQAGCADGATPTALVQAYNGDLYGTTLKGGAFNAGNSGTVFKVTPGGALTTLYSFCAKPNCVDGYLPSPLVAATNGDLYGTSGGGAYNVGTVFKITPGGTLTTIYNFCARAGCPDGSAPSQLVEAPDGDFYGVTSGSAAHNMGTVFKITPSGTLKTLYNFCSQTNCADGAVPFGGLVQATNGDLYGGTTFGGAGNFGTIFQITPSGMLTTLHSFCSQASCADGAVPNGPLFQATNGDLYGTAGGGVGAYGVIFSLSLGLRPFVQSLPTAGVTGRAVKILGTNLTGTTNVTFNGQPAVFTVASPSLIISNVLAGATTGPIEVVTPGGTLLSNVLFRVLP